MFDDDNMNQNNDMVNLDDLYYHEYEGGNTTAEEEMLRNYKEHEKQLQKNREFEEKVINLREQEKKRDIFVIISLVLMIGGFMLFIFHLFQVGNYMKFQNGRDMVYATVVGVKRIPAKSKYDSGGTFTFLTLEYDYKGENHKTANVNYQHGEFIKNGDVVKAYVYQRQDGSMSVIALNKEYDITWMVISALASAAGGVMFFLYHINSKRYTKTHK